MRDEFQEEDDDEEEPEQINIQPFSQDQAAVQSDDSFDLLEMKRRQMIEKSETQKR